MVASQLHCMALVVCFSNCYFVWVSFFEGDKVVALRGVPAYLLKTSAPIDTLHTMVSQWHNVDNVSVVGMSAGKGNF